MQKEPNTPVTPKPAIALETDRLTLRMLCESDFDFYAEMCADPVVMRCIKNDFQLALDPYDNRRTIVSQI